MRFNFLCIYGIGYAYHLGLAREMTQRCIILADGKVLYDGSVNHLFESKEVLIKAGFMHKHGGKGWHLHL